MRPWRYVPLAERGNVGRFVSERWLAGETVEALADDYAAFPDEVEAALRQYLRLRRPSEMKARMGGR